MINPIIIAGFLAGLTPPPQITVTQWSEANVVLTSASSGRPGPYSVEVTPFWEEPMDCLGAHSPIEEVIVKKSNQVGFTRFMNNWIGYTMDVDPCGILTVMPTKEHAEKNSVLNIATMIEDTASLRKKIGRARDRDSGNTVFRKQFPGGYWLTVGATSPNDARSTPFKKVGMDEVSAYPVDMGGEGDPYELFYGRTKTFPTRKILAGSTPTKKGVCRISSLFERTDQRKYHVPCPHCGHMQHFEFERLRWEKGKYTNVYYECIGNNCRIDERYKTKMMSKAAGAKWIPTSPANINPLKRGYHINALYAPLGFGFPWSLLVEKYDIADAAENREAAITTFTNLQLGEEVVVGGDIPEYERLVERAVDYKDGSPVDDVVRLTAGVDIQKDRIEVEVLGWASNKTNYSVAYEVLEGSTDADEVWEKLYAYLECEFKRPDGGIMNISYTCIDSGYLAYKVYEFCERFGNSRCVPVKGSDTQEIIVGTARPLVYTKQNKKRGSTMLRVLGVSKIKELIYSKLKLSIDYENGTVPPGYCYFPKDRSVYYFKGLCSEYYVENAKGRKKGEWVKAQLRNEPLDLRVYSYAAGYIQNYNRKDDEWFVNEAAKFKPERKEFTAPVKKERKKSDFWKNRP